MMGPATTPVLHWQPHVFRELARLTLSPQQASHRGLAVQAGECRLLLWASTSQGQTTHLDSAMPGVQIAANV